jgi:hypothetical protein
MLSSREILFICSITCYQDRYKHELCNDLIVTYLLNDLVYLLQSISSKDQNKLVEPVKELDLALTQVDLFYSSTYDVNVVLPMTPTPL